MGEVNVRLARSNETGFVISHWLRSLEKRTRAEEIEAGFWEAHREIIAHLVCRPECRTVVAADVEDDGVLYGFAVGEERDKPRPHPGRTVLHFAFVKRAYRRHGIARAMVETLFGSVPPPGALTVTEENGAMIDGIVSRHGWRTALREPFYRYILDGLPRRSATK